MEVSQEVKNGTAIWSSSFTSGLLPKESKNANLKTCMHSSIHSTIIYNGKDLEATWMSMGRWMDRRDTEFVFRTIKTYLHTHSSDVCLLIYLVYLKLKSFYFFLFIWKKIWIDILLFHTMWTCLIHLWDVHPFLYFVEANTANGEPMKREM